MLKLLKSAITVSPMEYVWINHAINKQAMTDWNQTVVCCLYKADHDPHQLIIYPEIMASTPLYGASQRFCQRIRYYSLPPQFDAQRPTRNQLAYNCNCDFPFPIDDCADFRANKFRWNETHPNRVQDLSTDETFLFSGSRTESHISLHSIYDCKQFFLRFFMFFVNINAYVNHMNIN